MNFLSNTIHSGYKNIFLVSDSSHNKQFLEQKMQNGVSVTRFKHAEVALTQCKIFRPDLIVLDLDAMSTEKARFYTFICASIIPDTPLVMITRQPIPTRAKSHLQSIYHVLDVLEIDDSYKTAATI